MAANQLFIDLESFYGCFCWVSQKYTSCKNKAKTIFKKKVIVKFEIQGQKMESYFYT